MMTKLIALAVAFTALVAFATAHTTIITTTFEDANPISSGQQCTRQLQGQQLNVCQEYLQQSIQSPFKVNYQQVQGEKQLQQQCCNQLQNIDEQCQCEAVKQVFQDVQQMPGQQGGSFGAQQVGQLMQKAQQLPNQCNLQISSQCKIRTVITNILESSQQCSEVQEQQFNQCQTYMEKYLEQPSSPFTKEAPTQELLSCCNEIKNVESECQCDALQEVYKQGLGLQQQKQSGRRGADPETVQRGILKLQNVCNLQYQQCKIPSAMF